MSKVKWELSPAAALLFAVLYFFDGEGLMEALVPAVLAHEAGHALFLRFAGVRLRRLSLGLVGLEMDYSGSLRGLSGAAAILAGPAAGVLYALVASRLSGDYFRLSAAGSLVLSAFNLLPLLPLDGGRLLGLALGERGRSLSRAFAWMLVPAALWLWLSRGWFSLFAMACWLLRCNLE